MVEPALPSITRRAFEVDVSNPAETIRRASGIRPSASSASRAIATSGISSGSSPSLRLRKAEAAASAAASPWYWATIDRPSTSFASLGFTPGPRSRSTSAIGISVRSVKNCRIGSSGRLITLPNWAFASSATPM